MFEYRDIAGHFEAAFGWQESSERDASSEISCDPLARWKTDSSATIMVVTEVRDFDR